MGSQPILLEFANFLASDFIDEVELPQLLQAAKNDGALILPVILDPCDAIFDMSELAQFQTVNPPSKPLSSMDENAQKVVFNQLAAQLKDL